MIDDFAIVMTEDDGGLYWLSILPPFCRSKAMMVDCIVLIVYIPSILSVESDDGGWWIVWIVYTPSILSVESDDGGWWIV